MQVKRTEGVSTTDIVGRMLMCGHSNRLVRTSLADQVRYPTLHPPSMTTRAPHPHSHRTRPIRPSGAPAQCLAEA